MSAIPFIIAICCLFSFIFSGMEAGVFALNRLRIRQLMKAGNARARVLHGFLENSEQFFWTILLGNTLSNLTALSLLAVTLNQKLAGRPWLIIGAFLAGVLLFFVLCELLPKSLFRAYPNRLSLALAKPFRILTLPLSPAVRLAEGFVHGLLRWSGGRTFTGLVFSSREELRVMMHEASGTLTTEEKRMIERVLDLQHLTVRGVLVPMEKAVVIPASMPVESVFQSARESGHSRFPVREADRIVGVINVKQLLFRSDKLSGTAREHSQPPLVLEETMRLEVALRRMQRQGQRIALVVDARQREVGLVSLQDILRTIFGEVTL